MISESNEKIIQATLPVVASNLSSIVNKFYELLLSNHPELTSVFNLTNQKTGIQPTALTSSIATFAMNYKNIDSIRSMIEMIANKHCSVGVKPEQYAVVGTTLIAAIDAVLGDAVTDQIRNAWAEFYWEFANILIKEENDLYSVKYSEFKNFKIINKVDESKNTFSLYLEPLDGVVNNLLPGQYISIKVNLGANEQIRQYSVSDFVDNKYIRITIKREDNYDDNTVAVSEFIYKNLHINNICQISAPFGTFTLNDDNNNITFISAGIGITPLICMLENMNRNNDKRKIQFVYLTENSDYHIFKQQLNDIKLPNFSKHIYYSNPNDNNVLGNDYESTLFNEQEIQKLVSSNTTYYLCGSNNLINSVTKVLIKNGVSESNIRHEIFIPNKWS